MINPEQFRQWDVFISHASEDKPFVRELAQQLVDAGVRVWFDDFVLEVGDSLWDTISEGLERSAFGIVVISPRFLAKKWPRAELEALFDREEVGRKVLLPVWHQVDVEAVRSYSRILAGRVAVSSELGVDVVVRRLLRVMFPDRIDRSTWEPVEIALAEIPLVILPVAPVSQRAAFISKHPITNEQYRWYLEKNSDQAVTEPVGESYILHRVDDPASGEWKGPFYPWRDEQFNAPDHPVVCVSFREALLFCNWLNSFPWVTVSLPKEPLWAFAAFGTEFLPRHSDVWLSQTRRVHHRASSPAPIDRSGERTNSRGVADLVGNVWEWCQRPRLSIRAALLQLPRSDPSRTEPVLRGGGYLDDLNETEISLDATELQDGAETRHADLGFRVAGRIDLDFLPRETRIHLTNLQEERGALDGEGYYPGRISIRGSD